MESDFSQMHSAAADACSVLTKAHMDGSPIPADVLVRTITALEAALAIKPKNFNVGTPEEWIRRHESYCGNSMDSFACINGPGSECKKCFAKWLDMPYEERGAE